MFDGTVTSAAYRTRDTVALTNVYSDAYFNEAWTNSNVFVLGNEAQKGGGIGSNANIAVPGEKRINFLSNLCRTPFTDLFVRGVFFTFLAL